MDLGHVERADLLDEVVEHGRGERTGLREHEHALTEDGERRDRHDAERTGELLLSIAAERSVLVIEHDMEFVRQIARTVTVLHQGAVLCEGPREQVQSDPRVQEVYLGQRQETHAVR